ncbi:hypothetical protein GK047_18545 [Paenibacillus sp. SYP-B3998]|uniref:Uncharacterized protein n=1 Tax=Paenibacillus sp. SYP-B3998 TaxID=2678564 RepID=A0A6G4A0T5_9BACL|nr:hypothetical protein [Paenibacillus sp. SYP-B3998]NEW08002.1 hypothetical protein [Paenibacillus sp. SYP-B3998]
MNSPDPDNLHKELESGPLQESGFTSKLQRNIERAIDRKERAKPRVKPFLCLAGLSAIVGAALLFPWDTIHTKSDAASAVDFPAQVEAQATSSSPAPISTALLIGLRTEHEAEGTKRTLNSLRYSTYRTMLIAPVRGKLQKTSEGSGILMPYKQNFWKIDSLVNKTKTDEFHYLSAHLADQPVKEETFTDDPLEELNHVETLVFAGNQYLSVKETEEAWSGTAPYQADRIWVRTLPQLKEGHATQFYKKPIDKNHVSMTDLYGPNISGVLSNLSTTVKRLPSETQGEITGQSWTVQRQPGRWVGKIAETPSPSSSSPDRYVLRDFPRELPDKVVNHDVLCCSWNDLRSSWPNATDALSSPMNDMIVIFEEDKLKFYPYGQAPNNDPQLTIDLQPGEQLVMAQWATDHYVQEWIDKVGKYLSYDNKE